jgi:uncharacterized protein (TIGR02117 family)
MRRWPVRTALALLAIPSAYLLLALVLGVLPVNREFQPTPPASGGISIYLRTNGVHADLVLPAAGLHDWHAEFPPRNVIGTARLANPRVQRWIAFGWGDREFYVHTRTWRDLRPGTAAAALLGLGTGAMHVEYLAEPLRYRALRIDVSASQYRALVATVQAGFRRDPGGAPKRIDTPGYFDTDGFYEGTGRYTLWLTSNEWVRRALAGAGIRTSIWAPFDAALFWQLS